MSTEQEPAEKKQKIMERYRQLAGEGMSPELAIVQARQEIDPVYLKSVRQNRFLEDKKLDRQPSEDK